MASSGTIEKKFHGGSTGGYYIGIDWRIVSQDKSSNSSIVHATAYIRASGSDYTIKSSAKKNITLTVNGTQFSGTSLVGLSAGQKRVLLNNENIRVPHNSDGTKTCTFAMSATVGLTLSGTYYGTISHSGSATLDKINLNTAPWWTSDDTRMNDIRAHVIIPENWDAVTVTSSTANDSEQGGNLHYDLHRYINGNYSAQIKSGGSGLSVTDYIGSWGQGTRIKYRANAHDGSLWTGSDRWSWEYTKNTFTRASVDSVGSIGVGTTTVGFRAHSIRNSGGGNGYVSNNFGYRIESLTSGVTIGGTATHSQGNADAINFILGVKNNGGNPTNPHWLDANELKNVLRSSNYCGNIKLRLVSWNDYGSQGSYDFNIWVDLRQNPGYTNITYDANNAITHGGTSYYIPAHLPFRFSWNAVNDPVQGNACTYDVFYQIGEGDWVLLGSTSSTTYTAYLGSTAIGNSKQTNFRIIVRAKTIYGNYSDTGGPRVTLWDYAPPTVRITSTERKQGSVVVKGTITVNSSIPNITLNTTHWRWNSIGTNHNFTPSTTNQKVNNFTITANIGDDFAGTMHVASSDSVRNLIESKVSIYWDSAETTVKGYMPVMSLNRLGLGVGTRVNDSFYKLMVDGNMKTNGLNVSGYQTTNTVDAHAGKWTKIASLQVTGRFGDANAIIKFIGHGSGDSSSVSGELTVRLKQQNEMGQAPGCSLYLNYATVVSGDNFKLVITSNTTSLTRGELWYKAARGYETVSFCPIFHNGSVNFFASQPYQTSLPSGSQISCTNLTLTTGQLTTKQNVYGRIPQINGDGVMEIGKYIDFHDGNNGQDYNIRLTCQGSTMHVNGGVSTGGAINTPSANIASDAPSGGRVAVVNQTGATSNHPPLLVESGGHTNWGTTLEIRTRNQGSDRPSILFSSANTSRNYTVGMGGNSANGANADAFTINTDHGIYNGSWGTNLVEIRPDWGIGCKQGWLRTWGNNGWYNESYGGGWYMTDSTWIRAYNSKNVFTPSGMKAWTMWARYFKSYDGNNVDIECDSGTGYINLYTGSGAGIVMSRPWSGSSGTEPCFYNNKGNGWGFLGNSGTTWFRVYGSGGSVSDRDKKYEITKADTEMQYENVKYLDIYNYRSLSTSDVDLKEIAEKFLTHLKFKNLDTLEYITDEVEIDGKIYEALDENLTEEEIKEKRIEQIIELNPGFGECKRQDLFLGCMVDEMPLETTFYDNEGGDGKAVDMYSYTTMILGATKHLIDKVETLELENEELKDKLDRMEELLNGVINKG